MYCVMSVCIGGEWAAYWHDARPGAVLPTTSTADSTGSTEPA